ncbi:hypothetical protein [Mycoplasma hafezii]|uniref:hypothetical protein n=1 Tax=Mycoplasma hafezii TaxID=525886 RepID=UPI003CE9F26D
MKDYKRKVYTWIIFTILGIVGIIGLSIGIHEVQGYIKLFNDVSVAIEVSNAYYVTESYMIGGLAFCCLITILGSIITYSGLKSLKYTEMFY